MKKVFAAVMALALILCVGTACTEKKNTLVIGIDDSFPPLGFRDEDNNIVGFDIDLATAVAEQMGMKVEFKVIDWDTKEDLVNNGQIDAIWNGYTITDARKEKVCFTEPYLANAQVVVVKADSTYNKLADFNGVDGKNKVAAQIGSSAVDAMVANEEFYASIGSDYKGYTENVSALEDLKIGRIDALVVDKVVAEYYISLDGNKDSFRILEEALDPEEYGIGVAKNNKELCDKIQKALNELCANGKAAEISTKWFGENKVLVRTK